MNDHVEDKKAGLSAVESQLKEAKNDLDPDSIRSDFELACELFPSLKEAVQVAKQCIGFGFSKEDTQELTQGKPCDSRANSTTRSINAASKPTMLMQSLCVIPKIVATTPYNERNNYRRVVQKFCPNN